MSSSRPLHRPSARGLVLAAALLAPLAAPAQSGTPRIPLLTGEARGLTELEAPVRRLPAAAAASAPGARAPGGAPALPPGPLPPDPAAAGKPVVFGSQIFSGRFGTEAFTGFNPDYRIASGDRISLRMWGAYTLDATQVVDAQGNLFIANVGPVAVRGVRNAELNARVEQAVKKTFRANVGVYATLEAAQPVKVYVTGFVRAPGLYGGLSSDSVLYYLDRAGGIDPDRGSYLDVQLLRGGELRARFDLYRFLLEGRIEPLQLQDGDTLVATPRRYSVNVQGEVQNPYVFETARPEVPATELLAMARPKPNATHLSISRRTGAERRSDYHALDQLAGVTIQNGDELSLLSDKFPGTILVRIEGAHLGERTLILPYGSTLRDAQARLRPAPQARIEALQLFRKSVAQRQKELIETSLRSLETFALTARSATSEEAALRGKEAQQILEFIDRARQVQPRGQVILAEGSAAGDTLLEDGDTLLLPERSNLVLVSGEVLFPTALAYDQGAKPADYIARAGGYTQGAERARMVLLRQDGSVAEVDGKLLALRPGDELMVLPKVETKNIEVTRGITQILFQIAVAARALFNL